MDPNGDGNKPSFLIWKNLFWEIEVWCPATGVTHFQPNKRKSKENDDSLSINGAPLQPRVCSEVNKWGHGWFVCSNEVSLIVSAVPTCCCAGCVELVWCLRSANKGFSEQTQDLSVVSCMHERRDSDCVKSKQKKNRCVLKKNMEHGLNSWRLVNFPLYSTKGFIPRMARAWYMGCHRRAATLLPKPVMGKAKTSFPSAVIFFFFFPLSF